MKFGWKKLTLISVIALIGAISLLGGTIIFAANQIEQVKKVETSDSSNQFNTEEGSITDPNYDFFDTQTNEESIADILNGYESSSSQTSSSQLSSNAISSSSNLSSGSSAFNSSQSPSNTVTSSNKPIKPNKPSSTPTSRPSSTPSSKPTGGASTELINIISGAVQREIVGTNSTPQPEYYEAYKAQAVACHSYMEYHKKSSGKYPTMSYSKPHPKTIELVNQVVNELMYYNGAVINAAYHAASGGYTQSARYIWGSNVPYLSAVKSKYDDKVTTYSISSQSLSQKLKTNGITTSGDPESWFDLASATYTDGSYVNTMKICNQQITGRKLRETVLGANNLKSCKIIDIDVKNDVITFTTRGYGHGAGLSQLGAMGYSANENWSYKQILTHYYTGISIR